MGLQLVMDCADPERLVRFWAAALGYRAYCEELLDGLCWGHAVDGALAPASLPRRYIPAQAGPCLLAASRAVNEPLVQIM